MNTSRIITTGGILSLSMTPVLCRPNIIFILADDQNKNTVGCYTENIYTPNIDYLADNGIRFNNANVVTTVSSPSRYCILTGRYYENNLSSEYLSQYPKGEASCMGNECYLERDGENLPSILQKNGYTTGFVGKFHLTGHQYLVNNKKWAEAGLQTYPTDSDPRTDPETNRKMKENHEWWKQQVKQFGFDYVNGVYAENLRELFNIYTNAHNVDWTINYALDFLDSQKDNTKQPFFLFVATTYPHGPAPHATVKGKYVNSLDADPILTGEGVVPELGRFIDERACLRAKYERLKQENPDVSPMGASALWWDNAVGKIISKVKELGIEDDTIIVYMSDHGVLRGGKSTLYEDGISVPLIIQWKNGALQGVDYNHIVGSIDIAPTLLDAAGVNIKRHRIDGQSLKPMFKDTDRVIRESLMLEMGYAKAVKTDSMKYIAIRYPENPDTKIDKESGKPYLMKHAQLAGKSAKARKHYFEPDQLYDYKSDPEENINLYGQQSRNDKRYKSLLKKEINRHSKRKFGEFYR